MIQVAAAIVFIYGIYVLVNLFAWGRTAGSIIGDNTEKFITVVLPARNEAANIQHILKDLQDQTLSYDKFEVLIVDDSSEDDTTKKIEAFRSSSKLRITLVKLDDSKKKGKKAAITEAIIQSRGNIIVTTDADCRLPNAWLKTYFDAYKEDTKMILGPVRFVGNSFFDKLQQLEFSGLIGIGAASLKLGIPNMCNGANLSYKKSLFEEISGYQGNDQIPSGDDEFLLQKAYDLYPDNIHFLKSKNLIVSTEPKKSAGEFLNQRIRWAGKWKYHRQPRMFFWAASVFLSQTCILILFLASLINVLMVVPILLLRAIAEFFYLKSTTRELNMQFSWGQFLMVQALYPFYIIILSIISLFSSYSWKGRNYS